MSKYVKDLITDHFKTQLDGVADCLVVRVEGLDANTNWALRAKLREKNLRLLVIKNSLARRAFSGTTLEPAVTGLTGPSAVVWGTDGIDFVSVAKEIVELAKDKKFAKLEIRGGAMDGEPLSPEGVVDVSKLPSREEMLSILSGQLLAPYRAISGQLIAMGGKLASQIEKKAKGDEGDEGEEAAPAE